MNLFETLKQLKKIEPDPAFRETSRRALFARMPAETAVPVHGISRVRMTILKIVETGVAVALTGFFILLLTGAFSGTGIAPQYAAVNPDALHAEAQAIDIQIQLANVNYVAPVTQSTAAAPQVTKGKTTGAAAAASASAAATSTATTTLTIDQALQNLAQ